MEPLQPKQPLSAVRIDKWLWSVRIFKSRTMAADTIKGGKVKIGLETAKPSQLISVGQIVTVKKDGFNWQYKVVQLIEKRVGAPLAVVCYEDITPEEERNKYNAWYINGTPTPEKREKGAGRPTKRDRRIIDKFKDGD